MTAEPDRQEGVANLHSRAFHITVDGGRDSFYALSIEERDSDEAWLMSDTVRALESMR